MRSHMLLAGCTPFTGSGFTVQICSISQEIFCEGLSTEVVSIGLQSPAAAQHRCLFPQAPCLVLSLQNLSMAIRVLIHLSLHKGYDIAHRI